MGLANFPFHDFTANAAWLMLVLIAQDLAAWTKRPLAVATTSCWSPSSWVTGGLRQREAMHCPARRIASERSTASLRTGDLHPGEPPPRSCCLREAHCRFPPYSVRPRAWPQPRRFPSPCRRRTSARSASLKVKKRSTASASNSAGNPDSCSRWASEKNLTGTRRPGVDGRKRCSHEDHVGF